MLSRYLRGGVGPGRAGRTRGGSACSQGHLHAQRLVLCLPLVVVPSLQVLCPSSVSLACTQLRLDGPPDAAMKTFLTSMANLTDGVELSQLEP